MFSRVEVKDLSKPLKSLQTKLVKHVFIDRSFMHDHAQLENGYKKVQGYLLFLITIMILYI